MICKHSFVRKLTKSRQHVIIIAVFRKGVFMPVYAEKELIDGQKRWYIRTYVEDEFGKTKQITKHNKKWIGRDGKKKLNGKKKN